MHCFILQNLRFCLNICNDCGCSELLVQERSFNLESYESAITNLKALIDKLKLHVLHLFLFSTQYSILALSGKTHCAREVLGRVGDFVDVNNSKLAVKA